MINLKSKIIPENMKANIDEIMEKQLFNANRYYAESNPDISTLMSEELLNIPSVFFRRLVERWNWHNSYYECLLEPAYGSLIKSKERELSPEEITNLMEVYYTGCLVDEATLIMSGVIKKYLDFYITRIGISDDFVSREEAKKMLLTPPTETFFAQYQIDHLYYIYLSKIKTEDVYKFKEYLKNKYHANDEVIFQSRFESRFHKYFDLTETQVLQEINSYKIPDSYKNRHFYFTLEHPERKAFRDIIVYDNLDEKLISYNLIGVSGFLLRKKILEYLNESKILPNSGYIYEFNNDTILKSLELLRLERRKKMDKEIKPYKQRGDTCAIVCMMMALEYYKIIPKANWYDERRLYRIYGSKNMDGTPFSALAYHFSKNGLNTSLYHSEKSLFHNNNNVIGKEQFEHAIDEYKEHLGHAIQNGTNVVNGIDIRAELLKQKLEEGNIVILAGQIGEIYHAILLSGYEEDKFIVCDPLYKQKQIKSFAEIEHFMNTSIGKWFLTVNDHTKEKDDLLQNLNKYQEESKQFMQKKGTKKLNYVR